MKKISDQERQLLQRVRDAGGRHCFGADDHIPAEGHKLLRSLARRGYLAIEPTDDGPLVILAPMGRAEVDHA